MNAEPLLTLLPRALAPQITVSLHAQIVTDASFRVWRLPQAERKAAQAVARIHVFVGVAEPQFDGKLGAAHGIDVAASRVMTTMRSWALGRMRPVSAVRHYPRPGSPSHGPAIPTIDSCLDGRRSTSEHALHWCSVQSIESSMTRTAISASPGTTSWVRRRGSWRVRPMTP